MNDFAAAFDEPWLRGSLPTVFLAALLGMLLLAWLVSFNAGKEDLKDYVLRTQAKREQPLLVTVGIVVAMATAAFLHFTRGSLWDPTYNRPAFQIDLRIVAFRFVAAWMALFLRESATSVYGYGSRATRFILNAGVTIFLGSSDVGFLRLIARGLPLSEFEMALAWLTGSCFAAAILFIDSCGAFLPFYQLVHRLVKGKDSVRDAPAQASAATPAAKVGSVGMWVRKAGSEPVLCLTGFGPFAGVPENPTALIIHELKKLDGPALCPACPVQFLSVLEVSLQGVDFYVDSVRTLFTQPGPAAPAAPAAPEEHPSASVVSVHLGVDGSATSFKLETTCYNNCTFRVPDQRGVQLEAAKIDPLADLDTPLQTLFRVDAALSTLQSEGFNVTESSNPGRFLCNYVYYKSSLAAGARQGTDDKEGSVGAGAGAGVGAGGVGGRQGQPVIFIHVPPFTVEPLERQVAFVRRAVQVLAECTLHSRSAGATGAQTRDRAAESFSWLSPGLSFSSKSNPSAPQPTTAALAGQQLFDAAQNGRVDEVRKLCLKWGAESSVINYPSPEFGHATPLIIACAHSHVDCIALLARTPSIQINATDDDGLTGLWFRAYCGDIEAVRVLVACPGIDLNRAPMEYWESAPSEVYVGKSPLTVAMEHGEAGISGCAEVARILAAAGARATY